MAQIKELRLFVISEVKKSDEILGVNEAKVYYDSLEKAHISPHGDQDAGIIQQGWQRTYKRTPNVS